MEQDAQKLTPLHYITGWAVVGPVHAMDAPERTVELAGQVLATPYVPDEANLDPSAPLPTTAPADLTWGLSTATDIEREHISQPAMPARPADSPGFDVLYTVAQIWSDREITGLSLLMSTTERARVWVNGEPIPITPSRSRRSDSKRAKDIRLQAGWNRIVVKHAVYDPLLQFAVRLAVEPDDKPGVKGAIRMIPMDEIRRTYMTAQHEKNRRSKLLQAQHGIVCRLEAEPERYLAWPSIARMADGTLVVAASGPRVEHACPFGKTSILTSGDDGATWSPPRVINDSPIDDRDAGIVSLGGQKLLVSWFTVDTRRYYERNKVALPPGQQERGQAVIDSWTDELVQQQLGTFVMLSDDGGANWSEPIRVPVSAPHGPIQLADGSLLYLGKLFGKDLVDRDITACRSADGGRTWDVLGAVPVAEGTTSRNYHEPHVVELPGGRLIGLIRYQTMGDDDPAIGRYPSFSIFQTQSDDGGQTWTRAVPLGFFGSPPHVIRHSSGKLVCVYGYRRPGSGQRVMISDDDGRTWDSEWIIREDGPGWDLGYPCSVELPDGSILTVYYQKVAEGEPCSILWSRWRLP